MKINQHTSWISIFSIAILLLFFGMFILLSFHVDSITDTLKKKSNIIVELEKDVSTYDVASISGKITDMDEYLMSSLEIISEQEALELMRGELNEKWVIENSNPFSKMMIFNIHDSSFNPENIEKIESEILSIKGVSSIYYGNFEFDGLESNISSFSKFLFALGVIFSLLTLVLLHNSIHFLLMNDRKKIKTMLLVGAKEKFVLMPYLRKAFSFGIIAYIIFGVITAVIMLLINNSFEIIMDILVARYVIIVLITVLIMALSIPMISTYMIVSLYLRKNYNIYS